MSPKSNPWARLMRGAISAAAFLVLTAVATAYAEEPGYSSSTDAQPALNLDAAFAGALAEPSIQHRRQQSRPYDHHSTWTDHLALEAGGGFTAPAEPQPDVTYGWNVTGGVGYKFTKHFSMLGEWQFNHNKIPGATLAAVGEPGGYVKTWSLTLDPVLSYKITGALGGYITGGGGFYRKVTSFTQPALATSYYCDYFSCYPYQYQTNVVVGHFSSNQGGVNIGTGLTFGNWKSGKFYTEARYVWLNSPGGGTKLIPVTAGFRW